MCQRAASLTVTPACGRRCDFCNTSDAWKEVMQVAAPVRPACGRLAGVADALGTLHHSVAMPSQCRTCLGKVARSDAGDGHSALANGTLAVARDWSSSGS